jgi:hypothetical protein
LANSDKGSGSGIFTPQNTKVGYGQVSHPIESFCVDEKKSMFYSITSNTGQMVKVPFDLH